MSHFDENAVLNNHQLKQERLVFSFSITANATPASKLHHVDLPGIVTLRSEGKTAEADAIEDLSSSFTTAVDDTNSVFGVLISKIVDLDKVLKITISELTSLAASTAITKLGVFGKTPEGNIAFNVTGTGLDLNSESPTYVVEIEYLKL
jgi:hypothetical protein